ncbi:ATP-grasp domain-containing protein [Actinokineospora cianjurensis]|uniref:Ribosomal protein S6--L-glutamate ligase n=1 Tax=Actinokineospora cianjurensis TaxID=585224 RepID=A0A421AXQ5_9PSEU|nr:ATP-grasp domain-containing protein [Actinokineospora cianjurensis]RLK54568.1 ribosomal protein S6--L-glutamate ligase [Actinokineospora cianjurensis]
MKEFLDGVVGSAGITDRHFVRHVERAVAELGGRVAWHSGHWIGELILGASRGLIIGYSFPLNNVASAKAADDKVATTVLLRAAKVGCVDHQLVRPGWSGSPSIRWERELPVVVKPNTESGGRGVRLVSTIDELHSAIGELSTRYRAIAWSSFLSITDEYRTVFLDGAMVLAFRKVRSDPTEWRHNLHLGATPEVCTDQSTLDSLAQVGADAMVALGLRFATVDVVVVDGEHLVMEVNSGVSLERFSRHSREYSALAGEVYAKAVAASVNQGLTEA